MIKKREEGPVARNWYRADRFIEDRGRWSFSPREGTIEGPFASNVDGTCSLATDTRVTNSRTVSQDSGLELSP